jgi:hypothetical protein
MQPSQGYSDLTQATQRSGRKPRATGSVEVYEGCQYSPIFCETSQWGFPPEFKNRGCLPGHKATHMPHGMPFNTRVECSFAALHPCL